MSRATQAAAQLQRVKQLAEEHGPALNQAYALLSDGALVGPAADRLLHTLSDEHRATRAAFYAAFDAVRRLAAEEQPPRVTDPYIPGTPRGGSRTASDERSGSPDALNRLGTELSRAGRSWQDAAGALSQILNGLGLSTAAATTISRAGTRVAAQKADIDRRRDELLKTDQIVQNAAKAAQSALSQSGKPPVHYGWDAYFTHYLPGLWDGTKELGLSALANNTITGPAYLMIAPKNWVEHTPIGQVRGLISGLKDPVGLAKATVNWDEWKRDPVRAYGEMVPSIVVTALTLGTGGPKLKTAWRERRTKPKTTTAETQESTQSLKEAANEAPKTKDLGHQNPEQPTPPTTSSPPKTPPPPDLKVAKGQGPQGATQRDPNSKGAVKRGQRPIQRGIRYEKYLVDRFGGEHDFKAGPRQFDGRYRPEGAPRETWFEAKSGGFWDKLQEDPKVQAKFKSSTAQQAKIALENGADFEVISETPIPEAIRAWLDKKNIPHREIPWEGEEKLFNEPHG